MAAPASVNMEKDDYQYGDDASPEALSLKATHDAEVGAGAGLKARQLLNPQPTDDPNDPVRHAAYRARISC